MCIWRYIKLIYIVFDAEDGKERAIAKDVDIALLPASFYKLPEIE